MPLREIEHVATCYPRVSPVVDWGVQCTFPPSALEFHNHRAQAAGGKCGKKKKKKKKKKEILSMASKRSAVDNRSFSRVSTTTSLCAPFALRPQAILSNRQCECCQ
jgi:hypothetical protein